MTIMIGAATSVAALAVVGVLAASLAGVASFGGRPETRSSSTSGYLMLASIVIAIFVVFMAFDYLKAPVPPPMKLELLNRNAPKLTSDWKLLPLESGEPLRLSQLKGKVVFLNLWATWCPPCVGEMPGLQNLYNEFKNEKDIQFLFVSVDDGVTVVSDFLKSQKFSIPVYQPGDEVPRQLSSTGIPITFVLDKEQRIVLREIGAREWDRAEVKDAIRSLLKPPVASDPPPIETKDQAATTPPKTSPQSP